MTLVMWRCARFHDESDNKLSCRREAARGATVPVIEIFDKFSGFSVE